MLVDWIPGRLVRLFAAPYVAGDRVEDGLEVAHELLEKASMLTTLDLLAEEVADIERVELNRQAYFDLIDRLGTDPRFQDLETRPTASVKLSSFTLDPLDKGGQATGSRESMLEVAERARQAKVALTIDMEDHTWTEFTLALAIELYESGHDVGTVLQSRLHRTEQDLDRVPPGMRIRTVIGIYPEPAEIALTHKTEMKDRLIDQSARLVDRGARVELATHDDQVLRRFLTEVVVPRSLAPERYELQLLYGVPRARSLADARSGRMGTTSPPRVRLYVPYATAWDQAVAYCRRRLASNPDLALYVMRNFLSSLGGGRGGIHQYVSEDEPAPQA